MKYRFWFILLCSFFVGCGYSQTTSSNFRASSITSIPLFNVTLNKDSYHLALSDNGYTLFVFLSPDCPLCKNYSSTLNSLTQQFKTSVTFYGIVPGKTYVAEDINNFQSTYHISFPLLLDKNKQLSTYLNASVTPEVILLDNKQKILYRGAIDNWAVSLGKQRQKATQSYLRDAIEQSLQHQPVAIKKTQPVGCRINDF